MTASELIEAATRLRERHGEWRYVEGDSMYFKDVIASCDHILSTVRPDDDEPVTRDKFFGAEGWGFDPLEQEWKRIGLNGVSVSFEGDRAFLWTGSFYTEIKSMGHLRRLVAALGERWTIHLCTPSSGL